MNWLTLDPSPENNFFVPKDFSSADEYRSGWSIIDAFAVWQNGLKTDRDELFFDFDKSALDRRMRHFYAPKLEPQFRDQYQVVASSSYDIEARRLATRFAYANIAHYQKVVVALAETIRLMAEIDKVIVRHGGWPSAFAVSGVSVAPAPATKSPPPDLGLRTEDELPLC